MQVSHNRAKSMTLEDNRAPLSRYFNQQPLFRVNYFIAFAVLYNKSPNDWSLGKQFIRICFPPISMFPDLETLRFFENKILYIISVFLRTSFKRVFSLSRDQSDALSMMKSLHI